MRQEPQQPPEQAARRLADDSADLVRAELARLREELREIVRNSAGGVLLTAVAGVSGLLALHALATSVQRAADRALPPRAAPAVLVVTYLGGAAAAGVLGARQLRQARLAADRAARNVRTDINAATPT